MLVASFPTVPPLQSWTVKGSVDGKSKKEKHSRPPWKQEVRTTSVTVWVNRTTLSSALQEAGLLCVELFVNAGRTPHEPIIFINIFGFRWQRWVKTRTNKNPKYHQITFPATTLTRVSDIYPGSTLFYCLAEATAPLHVTHNPITVAQSQGVAGFECHRPSAGQSGQCCATEVLFCVLRIRVCLFWCGVSVRRCLCVGQKRSVSLKLLSFDALLHPLCKCPAQVCADSWAIKHIISCYAW